MSNTAFFNVLQKNLDSETLEFIVKNAKNPKAIDEKSGKTALHILASKTDESAYKAFQYLVSLYRDLSDLEMENRCLKCFLRKNLDPINVNHRDAKGRTALHYAAKSGNDRIARVLVDNKANIHIQDKEGNRPYDLINSEDPMTERYLCTLLQKASKMRF